MKISPLFSFPNGLSFFRLILGALIPLLLLWSPTAGLLAAPRHFWAALILFAIGAATDYWDGWIARRQRLETEFGRILDPLADKVFILGAMASFAMLGIYSHWLLVPIFVREIFITFCRMVWLRQGKAVGAERAGKIKFGFQVGSVLVSFGYLIAPSKPLYVVNQIVLILAVGMTLYSGYFFLLHNRMLLKEREFAKHVGALGVGFLKPFPGTYGTLLGMVFLPLVAHDPWLHLVTLGFFLALAYLFLPRMGLSDHEDPLEVIIDEVCGILLAFWNIRLTGLSLVLGFFAFRFFDVAKVFPINWLEKRPGAHGILWDDLGAGLYTWLILTLFFK